MNAPRRHSRPEPLYPTKDYTGGSSKGKAGRAVKSSPTEPEFDQFGQPPTLKKMGDRKNTRTTWGS